MNVDDTRLIASLVRELGTILGAMVDAPIESATGTLEGHVWRLRISTPAAGLVTLAFDEAGAAALARVTKGDAAVPSTESIGQTLREVGAQLTTTALLGDGATAVTSADLGPWTPVSGATVTRFSAPPLGASLTVAVLVERGAAADAAVGPTRSNQPSAEERLDVILDIDLPLVVRFGCTDMTLKALTRLGPGSLIDLGRAPDDPVEVLVGNRVVAHGEVVVVAGSYGIRILDVVSPRERMPGVEAR